MPRKIIPLVTGETYHVFNRGVDKRIIFKDKTDYFRFHKSLQLFNSEDQTGSVYEQSFKKDWIDTQTPLIDIHAYCLLKNHFHLLLTQLVDGGVSEFMKRLGGGYTLYFNERYKRSGSLFQGTFKRVHICSNEQLLYLGAYVNLNNLVHDTSGYFLSSADVFKAKRAESFVKTGPLLKQYKNPEIFIQEAEKTVADISRRRKLDAIYDQTNLLE